MKFYQYIISSAIFLAIMSGCGSSKKAAVSRVQDEKPAEPGSNISEEQRINSTYAYFNAVKEKLTGNTEKAAELFASVLRNDPKNHAAMYELASIYNDNRKYNDALFFARNAAELDPDNTWYQMLLADTYERTGRYSDATSIYQKLVKKEPERVDFYFNLAEAYLYQGKITEAIKVYDDVESKIGVSRELTVQKQRLYLKQGKVTEAASELEKLIKSDPSNLDYYSMLVELYQVNNMSDKAMQTIERMKDIDPENPHVLLSLAEYYRSNNQKDLSFEQLKKAFRSNQLVSEIKIRILTSYLPLVSQDSIMLGQALELSSALSETHPSEANPQAVYGDFLSIAERFSEAREQYRKALAIDKKNLQAWQQLLIIESELRDWNAMETEADEALSYFADQSVLYLFSGIAKAQNKKHEDAASTLLSGSKLVVDNDAQLMEFYSNLGDAYNQLKKYDDSDKYYEKALAIDPNNVTVLNNYAYYLSVRGTNLDRAAEMSKKSNELSPNVSSYEDTYAWVLYKQGKYKEAKEWMEKAMKSGGANNGTLLEHYGDILFRLGNTQEAVTYWEQAKRAGDYSEFLDRKLNDKKLYE